MLVGGFNPSEKLLVSWNDYSKHMEKIKAMFQTTNQHEKSFEGLSPTPTISQMRKSPS